MSRGLFNIRRVGFSRESVSVGMSLRALHKSNLGGSWKLRRHSCAANMCSTVREQSI
jgi:hypothetical protein